MPFTDDDDRAHREKRKNDELQLELEKMRSRNRIIVAIIGLIGVIIAAAFVPVIPDSSSPSAGRIPFIVVIANAISNKNDGVSAPTLTPNMVGTAMGQTVTPIVPTQLIIDPTDVIPTTIPDSLATSAPPTGESVTAAPSNAALCPPLGSPDAIFSQPITTFGDAVESAGTGILANPVRPFGNVPTSYRYVKDALTNDCVQVMNWETRNIQEVTRQCMLSRYNTNLLWAGTVQLGTSYLVRRSNESQYTTIGTVNRIAPDSRQYLVQFSVSVGDELCIEAPSGTTLEQIHTAGGYHLWIGRDLLAFANSWCLMLENNDGKHYCP